MVGVADRMRWPTGCPGNGHLRKPGARPGTPGTHKRAKAAGRWAIFGDWVSVRGAIMIGGQRVQAGLIHARKTAEVTVEADTCQITVEPGITISAPRTTSSDIRRHKASSYD
jgi:hypothetical protein